MAAGGIAPRWEEPAPVDVPAALRDAVGGPPVLAETLVRRGYDTPERAQAFLDPRYYRPAPAGDMPDMTRAADRIERALRDGERIGVWGDFDVDGQTSTTLLVETLRRLEPIRCSISRSARPNRMAWGWRRCAGSWMRASR